MIDNPLFAKDCPIRTHFCHILDLGIRIWDLEKGKSSILMNSKKVRSRHAGLDPASSS